MRRQLDEKMNKIYTTDLYFVILTLTINHKDGTKLKLGNSKYKYKYINKTKLRYV